MDRNHNYFSISCLKLRKRGLALEHIKILNFIPEITCPPSKTSGNLVMLIEQFDNIQKAYIIRHYLQSMSLAPEGLISSSKLIYTGEVHLQKRKTFVCVCVCKC